ncbi:MAG: NAD(P)-dependent oxidoreductase [Xanthomonadales bacterium]|jgi:nucleoside-diphosphate-sugar epimerase|nr:NAD(P)-dependent oxidoreductase [Xanthomonadales bacterium]
MRVLVLGGSSQLGVDTLPALLAAGAEVDALSRREGPSLPGLRWLPGALPQGSPALRARYDAILSLGPLDLCGEWLAHAPAAGRIVAFGSTSLEAKACSPDPGERDLARRLAEAEARLHATAAQRGMAALVLRSTLIYGAGLDRSLSPLARLAARWRVLPFPRLIGEGGQRQPVHTADLAGAAVSALRGLGDRALPPALVLSGPPLSWRRIFAAVAASVGAHLLRLPLPLARLGATLAGATSARAMLGRFDHDQVFDGSLARALLDFRPRDFNPTAATWQPRTPEFPC